MIARLCLLAPLLVLPFAEMGCGQSSARVRADAVAFVGVHVVSMTADTILGDHTVVVVGDRIAAVGPVEDVEVPVGATIVDGAGQYLMPGLVDFHVHLRAESELLSYLAHGVTTVVNMRGSPELLDLAARVAAGEASGPWIYTSGPLVDGDPPIWSGSGTRIVTNPEEARAAVDEQVRLGYDLIKTYNNLEPASLEALVQAADARGLAVVGHIPRNPDRSTALQRALDAGMSMIAHGEEFFFTFLGGSGDATMSGAPPAPSPDRILEAARMAAEAGVAVTPNLSFIAATARMLEDLEAVLSDPEFRFLDPDVREMWREQNPTNRADTEMFAAREAVKYPAVQALTLELSESGVLLLLGTDASAPGLYPGSSALLELEELVAAGLTPPAALAAGTRNAHTFLDAHVASARPVGTVEVGKAADLLLLRADPLTNVSALRERVGIMARGLWFPQDRLDQLREEAAKQ